MNLRHDDRKDERDRGKSEILPADTAQVLKLRSCVVDRAGVNDDMNYPTEKHQGIRAGTHCVADFPQIHATQGVVRSSSPPAQ